MDDLYVFDSPTQHIENSASQHDYASLDNTFLLNLA